MLEQYNCCLVTGGLGFIGKHLVEALLKLNKKVLILTKLNSHCLEPLPDGAKLIVADIRNFSQLVAAVKESDIIFHVAANINTTRSVEDPRFDFEVNALGTFNILETAIRIGARRLVYVSSAAVYGRPQRFPLDEEHPTRPFLPYGASKLSGELSCLSFSQSQGLPVVIGRPFCVYGPGENPKRTMIEVSRYLRWHLNGQSIRIIGDARVKTRDFVHVDDVVSALLLLAEKGENGEAYNIGSGEEVSMSGLVDLIGSATGRHAIIEENRYVTEDSYRLVADISKLKSLGYQPTVSLWQGIEKLVEELGERPDLPSVPTRFKVEQLDELKSMGEFV